MKNSRKKTLIGVIGDWKKSAMRFFDFWGGFVYIQRQSCLVWFFPQLNFPKEEKDV